jgi:hypothetical protein
MEGKTQAERIQEHFAKDIFGPTSEEGTRGWRKLHNGNFVIFTPRQILFR